MAEPIKSGGNFFPKIEEAMISYFGRSREDAIRNDICLVCKKNAVNFNNYQAEIQYRKTGLCQPCQDLAIP